MTLPTLDSGANAATLGRLPLVPPTGGGAAPHLATLADLLPWRSEAAVGAMMPWAGRLWMVTYVAHKSTSGSGTGLFEIGPDFSIRKRPEGRNGTYANRMVHHPSNQLIIGPHIIDAHGHVRTFESLTDLRLCGACEHLHDPENKLYLLGMEGELVEANVHTLETWQLFNLVDELQIPKSLYHFKACHTSHGRVVVANNCYDESDYLNKRAVGRLAEWTGDPKGGWKILERKPFYEVHGRRNFGGTIFATGWDAASALLKVFSQGQWQTYRLPKASQNFDETVQCEWPRIRELEHERFLMDCHGMFYELAPHLYEGKLIRIRPVCSHLMVVSEFASFRGMLVLGGNQNSPGGLQKNYWNNLGGDPTAGIWLGHIDDLWRWGKPFGYGGPWWRTPVQADQPSDPYLMTGFEHKCVHVKAHDGNVSAVRVELDFMGNGQWCPYTILDLSAAGYACHAFPTGLSAHWVRLIPQGAGELSAQFHYT